MYINMKVKTMVKKIELIEKQRELLLKSGLLMQLSEVEFLQIVGGEKLPVELAETKLVDFLRAANMLYRAGVPIIEDERYDLEFLAELRTRNPDHPYLHAVEPEFVLEAKTVALPVRMLSTEKAYDFESIRRWSKRIAKAATEIDLEFDQLLFRATPKLDGFAAYDDGNRLYTRGDGRKGTDITRAFTRGLQVAVGGERGLGPGEIVVTKRYFEEKLSEFFDNSRNFQASLIKEKELEQPAAEAIEQGAAVFFPFALLPSWEGRWEQLEKDFDTVVESLWQKVDYDIDGIVFEVAHPKVREHMGATRHHHRWQIAFKRNTEMAEVNVIQVLAQTSRSGRVNPVAEIEPTRLSGALIKRASAHHYAMVRDKGIGAGARIRLSRSGEVIPKIEEVLVGVRPQIPESCPSCQSELQWAGDYLTCINLLNCPAQITNSIEHFFKVLGNVDGFGPSSVKKIYEAGVVTISGVYGISEQQFESFGFGAKQAENMIGQLLRSRTEAVEDWRFLAAFGVHRLGMGNCEKLLSVYPLERVFGLTAEEIIAIKGFSEKIAAEVTKGLSVIREEFERVYELGFNLVPTKLEGGGSEEEAILAGKVIVFTGTMKQGSRDEMIRQAKELGATVGKSITGKTTMLVCGQKVGQSKLKKAEALGVEIIEEKDYLLLLENR